jgi:hypothetical protein
MTTVLVSIVGVLALAILAAPVVSRWLTRRRLEAPEIAALCMSFDTARHARLELRIMRPARSPDWTIRRVEWLAPRDAGIAPRSDALSAARALDTHFAPGDPQGRWFAEQASIWVRYPADCVPVHRVRLRLSLEGPNGRRRSLKLSTVFPAMNWTPVPPRRQQHRPSLALAAAARGGVFEMDQQRLEARSWDASGWNSPGLA